MSDAHCAHSRWPALIFQFHRLETTRSFVFLTSDVVHVFRLAGEYVFVFVPGIPVSKSAVLSFSFQSELNLIIAAEVRCGDIRHAGAARGRNHFTTVLLRSPSGYCQGRGHARHAHIPQIGLHLTQPWGLSLSRLEELCRMNRNFRAFLMTVSALGRYFTIMHVIFAGATDRSDIIEVSPMPGEKNCVV